MRNNIRMIVCLGLISLLVLNLTSGCKKDTVTETVYQCSPDIEGLYEGTYTVGAGSPVPAGTQFYFSFSIYPNGKMSYKSKGFYNGSSDYITFADGTFTLTNTQFSFNATTINVAGGGAQHSQSGTATFDSNNRTLTNGTITDPLGGSATWSMTKVN